MSVTDISGRMENYVGPSGGKGVNSRTAGKAAEKKGTQESGFGRVLSGKGEADRSVSGQGVSGQGVSGQSISGQSMAEYMQYINDKISELSRGNRSRRGDVFIYISEEGYRAMQKDPEYEAWVLQSIRDAYAYPRSWCGHEADYHSVHLFGATKEEYRGQSWYSGCRECEQERRREQRVRKKKRLKALLKKQQERKWLEKERLAKLHLEKEVYKKILARRRLERERRDEQRREAALARREAASAFRMYMAALKYSE